MRFLLKEMTIIFMKVFLRIGVIKKIRAAKLKRGVPLLTT
jgi:hypothetical protein